MPGQSLDQGALAVVDMAGRADDDVALVAHAPAAFALPRRRIFPSDSATTRPMRAARETPRSRRRASTLAASAAGTDISRPPDVWGS